VFIGVATLPVFGLKLTGQWYLALPLLVLGVFSFFSIGLLAGSFAKTEEAATGLANFIVLPMAFLSGSFFNIDAAPAWLRGVSEIFPLRHLNDGMLAVLGRGQGIHALLVPGAVLIAFTLVIGSIAALLFRWDDA
jgi:ABC-2 type transport system permease protein